MHCLWKIAERKHWFWTPEFKLRSLYNGDITRPHGWRSHTRTHRTLSSYQLSILNLKMIKCVIIAAIFAFAACCHGAPHTMKALEGSEKQAALECVPLLENMVRVTNGKLEVTEEQARLFRTGRLPCHTYTPPPPPPTSCPCKCTDYMTALSQCKGFSSSTCWLIGPPKCAKGQLSCCC